MGRLLPQEPKDELNGSQNTRRPDARRCGPTALVLAVLGLCGAAGAQTAQGVSDLPDAPSAQMSLQAGGGAAGRAVEQDQAVGQDHPAKAAEEQTPSSGQAAERRCNDSDYPKDKMPLQGPPPCIPENPLRPFVTSEHVQPLTSKQKGQLALRDFSDPFNFLSVAVYSAFAVGTNSHTAYGPGMKGFGKLTGYGLAQAAQGEFIQTYAIPSLAHQDPRYHRMPTASVKRRIWHAIEHTYVTHHDDGSRMPNYATLLNYPIGAELSDLYVPGIQRDLPSTARRVVIGIATDPAGALEAEFLPDVAKRIHIHILFVQEILNRAIVGAPTTTSQ